MAVNARELAKVGCKYLGRLYSEMDCQQFVENCLKDCGNYTNLAGSNAWYRKMTWVGSPSECKSEFGSIPDGAFLFILEQDGKEPAKYQGDHIGNASHIGIYTGMSGAAMVQLAIEAGNNNAREYNFGNGAIHSSHSKGHVCTSNFAGKEINGGWNKIGLWVEVDYGTKINALLRGETTGHDDPGTDDDGGIPGEQPITNPASETTPDNGAPEEDEVMTAVVRADSGSTVKMRQKPSKTCRLYEKVPIGSTVEVLKTGTDWCKISWGGRKGWYMMTKFLEF